MEVVLETATPEGIRVILPALVYAKVLEEHAAVADFGLIDRTIRSPDERRPDPRHGRERFLRRERGLLVLAVVEFGEVPAIIVTVFLSSPGTALMAVATVHVIAADVELAGSYEEIGDVLYLSAQSDDKSAAAQETPEGHAVRLDAEGHITHITAINAKWLLDRDGELVATLRDGRSLRLTAAGVAAVMR